MTDAHPKVIAVINQTHDLGKTFITANLAATISKQGIAELLIDLDPQADLSWALSVPDVQPSVGVDRALLGELALMQLMLPMTDNSALIAAGQQLDAFNLILLDCAAISGFLGMNAVMTGNDIWCR